MSKDYMKSGELREGDNLVFDGVGFFTEPAVDHFKVNKWMRKQGFAWESDSNGAKGIWVDQKGDSDHVEQDEAARMYANRRRWWQL